MLLALTAVVLVAAAPQAKQVDPPVPSAAVWKDRIIVADGAGGVRAWNLELSPDPRLSAALSAGKPLAIAAGESLQGFDGSTALAWNAARSEWERGRKSTGEGAWLGFTLVADAPVLVRPTTVERLSDGKLWRVARMEESQVDMTSLNHVKVIASAGSTLAIGTSYGEWGGHLITLDLATGAWHHFYDGLGYVTGIAWTGSAWAVAWSMSHFEATTHVRLHRPDATVLQDSPRIRGKYLRALVWTGKLQGIEQDDLVDIPADLTIPAAGAALGKLAYSPEPKAIGVGSGIASFVRVDAKRVLIVPIEGAPILAGPGGATPLADKPQTVKP